MNRATIVYVFMLLLAGGGMWSILAIGKNQRAPTDLAGKWQLTGGPSTQPSSLTIEQSGYFFQAAIDDGPKLSFRLTDDIQKQINDKPGMLTSIANSNCSLDFLGPADGDEMMVTINRPRPEISGQWTAKRVVRTFSADKPKSGGVR